MYDFFTFLWANFLVGITAFGGGKAFIPIYKYIYIDTYNIVENITLSEIVAYASSLPGPIAPMITGVIGFDLYGFNGLFFGILILSLPSVFLFFLTMIFLGKSKSKTLEFIYNYMHPAIIGLLFFVVFDMLFHFSYGFSYFLYSLVIFIVCFLFFFKVKFIHPALIILISGILGIFLL